MIEAREKIKEILNLEAIEYFCFRPISEAEIINHRLLPESVKTAIVFLIPYRTDKAPSEYTTIDNIIDKPLRTSSYNLNVRNY